MSRAVVSRAGNGSRRQPEPGATGDAAEGPACRPVAGQNQSPAPAAEAWCGGDGNDRPASRCASVPRHPGGQQRPLVAATGSTMAGVEHDRRPVGNGRPRGSGRCRHPENAGRSGERRSAGAAPRGGSADRPQDPEQGSPGRRRSRDGRRQVPRGGRPGARARAGNGSRAAGPFDRKQVPSAGTFPGRGCRFRPLPPKSTGLRHHTAASGQAPCRDLSS